MVIGLKKKLFLAMATTALGATMVAGGTSALFTDTASNTDNTFTAGTVVITLDKADIVEKYFDISNIAPGDSASSPVVVTNTGTLELRYDIMKSLTGELAAADPDGDGATLGDNNPLTVKVYSDAAMTVEATNDNVLAPGAAQTLYVKWALPLAAGNGYQGKSAIFSIQVDAEQTKNN
ncbi:TasA family protein [Paenibacillus sp. Soil522]|uniref:TasA family protein n=1 Tax=Paenibacillus sp. Soil522 TaxID=1736388 RepID=UPI0006FE1044|nr:TasA family protein [Paenibacillus sp. Soil522]KRE51288.1 hypothetical protein ASG81_03775 [Paenibacillus sp. Soil522]